MTKREVEDYIMSLIFSNTQHAVTAENVRNSFAPIIERVWVYLESKLGDLSQLQLQGADKQSVVNAINAVLSKLNHDITLTKQEIATLGSKVGELDGEIFGDGRKISDTLSPTSIVNGYSVQSADGSAYQKATMSTAYYAIKAGAKVDIAIPLSGSNFHQAVSYFNYEEAPTAPNQMQKAKVVLIPDAKGNGARFVYSINVAESYPFLAISYTTENGVPTVVEEYQTNATPNVVKITPQNFTEEEKAIARNNIDAPSKSDVSMLQTKVETINTSITSLSNDVSAIENEISETSKTHTETLSPASIIAGYSVQSADGSAYQKATMSTAYYAIKAGAKVDIAIPLSGSNFHQAVSYFNYEEAPTAPNQMQKAKVVLIPDAKGNDSALTYVIEHSENYKFVGVSYVTANGEPTITQEYVSVTPPNFVKTTPCDYTEDQKQIARQNLGIDTMQKKSLKILVMGNSFSQDSFNYAPFIVKGIEENCDLTVGVCVIGGCKMVQHCANFTGQTQILEGVEYTPRNYGYFEYTNGASAWKSQVTKTAKQALEMYDWDIVTFQMNGMNNYGDYDTYYAPFCNKTFNAVNTMVSKPIKIGWLLTHGSYCWGKTEALEHWQGSKDNTIRVLKETSAEVVFPYGTAIENLRTTTITTSYKSVLLADDAHLQEGISTLCASYSIAISLLKIMGYGTKGIWGEKTRPDLTWLTDRNMQGMNFAVPNVVEGITEDNCRLAQASAIKAEMYPFEVTRVGDF